MPIHLVLAGVRLGEYPRLESRVKENGGQLLAWDGICNLDRFIEDHSISVDETICLVPDASCAPALRRCRLAMAAIGTSRFDGLEHCWNNEAEACRWLQAQSQLETCAWPIATVGGLVFRPDGRALFVRTAKWSGTWGVPGGKIDHGETHLHAFAREILEETGLQVDNVRLVLVQDSINEPQFYRNRHFLLLNYVAEVDGTSEVRLNHESLEFGWFHLEEASTLDLNRPTRQLLEQLRVPSSTDLRIGS